MPDDSRSRHGVDSRRGHPLQHRDRNDDQAWAERGTWTHLRDDTGGNLDSRGGEGGTRRGSTVDDSPVRQTDPSAHSAQSTQRSDTAQKFGSARQGHTHHRETPDRSPGDMRNGATHKSKGNPRAGSHRDTRSDSVASEAGGQFGDLHGPRPSDSRKQGYHEEEWSGSRRGRQKRDRQFGSRRGHGSRRREDPRTR